MLKENKLRAKIVERDFTIEKLSKEIGIDKTTFYRKMANNSFLLKEVDKIVEVLNIAWDEAADIFFGK